VTQLYSLVCRSQHDPADRAGTRRRRRAYLQPANLAAHLTPHSNRQPAIARRVFGLVREAHPVEGAESSRLSANGSGWRELGVRPTAPGSLPTPPCHGKQIDQGFDGLGTLMLTKLPAGIRVSGIKSTAPLLDHWLTFG